MALPRGIKRLGPSRYRVRVNLKDHRTGKIKRKTKIVEGTLDDAIEEKQRLRRGEKTTKRVIRRNFREYANKWVKRHGATRLRKSTNERYVASVAHLNAEWGDWFMDAVDVEAVEDWQAAMAECYANPTVNGWHRVLRTMLKAAVRQGVLMSNPAEVVDLLPEGRTKGARAEAYNAEQLGRFVAKVHELNGGEFSRDIGRQLLVIAWAGLRISESIALCFDDVVDDEIRVERSVYRGEVTPNKSDDPRRVYLSDPLKAIIDEQRQWLIAEQHPGLFSGLVFPAAHQQALAGASRRKGELHYFRSRSLLAEPINTVTDALEIPRCTPHAFRRTLENIMREAGVEDMVRRALHGWADENSQGIYATVSKGDRQRASGKLVRLVQKSGGKS